MVLKRLKIEIEELEISKGDKNRLLVLISEIAFNLGKGLIIENFTEKIKFLATLIKNIK